MLKLLQQKSQPAVQVLDSQDPRRMLASLTLSMRLGKAVAIMNIDSVHPALFGYLRKEDAVKKGWLTTVEVGPELVECPDTFRLLLFARDASAISKLPPMVRGLVTPINFVLTQQAVEQQLLGRRENDT
ncbi:dynein heavy chain [Cystoisospora suis]|uniref:Dynein heavy chain n=1 Tax=Cystoisospora suis TaxID=483139 RepID=A0A2C6KLB5_9APIC|nr:dynein heavy chain [Cystoisospora suis]